MEAWGEDDEDVLKMITAARQATEYRRLAAECPQHRDRFTRLAAGISMGIGVLIDSYIAHRQAEGLGGSCA